MFKWIVFLIILELNCEYETVLALFWKKTLYIDNVNDKSKKKMIANKNDFIIHGLYFNKLECKGKISDFKANEFINNNKNTDLFDNWKLNYKHLKHEIQKHGVCILSLFKKSNEKSEKKSKEIRKTKSKKFTKPESKKNTNTESKKIAYIANPKKNQKENQKKNQKENQKENQKKNQKEKEKEKEIEKENQKEIENQKEKEKILDKILNHHIPKNELINEKIKLKKDLNDLKNSDVLPYLKLYFKLTNLFFIYYNSKINNKLIGNKKNIYEIKNKFEKINFNILKINYIKSNGYNIFVELIIGDNKPQSDNLLYLKEWTSKELKKKKKEEEEEKKKKEEEEEKEKKKKKKKKKKKQQWILSFLSQKIKEKIKEKKNEKQ